VLDNNAIVRILRHREPYELQLLSVETAAELPGFLGRPEPTPVGQLTILSAVYGARDSWVDLTEVLNNRIQNNTLEVRVSNELGGDPIYGVEKKLNVGGEFAGGQRGGAVLESAHGCAANLENGRAAHSRTILFHEQYFRKELSYYQPTVMEKVRAAVGWVHERGYKTRLLGRRLSGDSIGVRETRSGKPFSEEKGFPRPLPKRLL